MPFLSCSCFVVNKLRYCIISECKETNNGENNKLLHNLFSVRLVVLECQTPYIRRSICITAL